MTRLLMRTLSVGIAFLFSATMLRAEDLDLDSVTRAISPELGREENGVRWYSLRLLTIEGQGFNQTKSPYDRLPARAESTVRDRVWELSQHSAGICARFMTDATAIHVHWKLTSESLAMPHMPATGVSGVDLYVRRHQDEAVAGGPGHAIELVEPAKQLRFGSDVVEEAELVGGPRIGWPSQEPYKIDEHWLWAGHGTPQGLETTEKILSGLDDGVREFCLYLPLYNGVSLVEIGIPADAKLAKAAPREKRPIVFYGTSITQGGCASRPGMAHVAIVGRRLDRPVINLGFSGNGLMEPEVGEFLKELSPAVFVIDCLPNMSLEQVAERTEPLVAMLRGKHADTPILLVEDRTFTSAHLVPNQRKQHEARRAALRKAFENLIAVGDKNLHYLEGEGLLHSSESTVDGSHPTDLGFVEQAQAFEAALRPILCEP